jgi:hypothetical protein
LAICQVSDEIAEFISAVDEIRVVDDLAKNEWIFLVCHITLISVTLNGVIGKPRIAGYADWRNAKWRNVRQKPSENRACIEVSLRDLTAMRRIGAVFDAR